MSKSFKRTKKGYVLIATIIISLFLSITAVSIYTVVYRYTTSISRRINDLRIEVYDDGTTNQTQEGEAL